MGCFGFYGCGTIFKITSLGKLTILHRFDSSDGAGPFDGLTLASDGNFYGTTLVGGSFDGGTVFKATPSGTVTNLYSFCCHDGENPDAGLVQGTDGHFYGTTSEDGADYGGTVFSITPGGTLTTLHSFDGPDGNMPLSGLLQATTGSFYGTTALGGDLTCNPVYGCGTVFGLDMGLGVFVTFVRFAGKVGQTGPILGEGFTGTTSVSINGIQANFTVISDTYIRATVPEGATTGYVTVTTPSGVLTSNVPFRVLP